MTEILCKRGVHPNAVVTGECYEGCCDEYYCPECGKYFKIEVAQ